jgi:DNA helicase-2/ATP-dependent DNA helicase PcrA
MNHDQNYSERYALLNEAQRLAVDTIEGPVMVIAGPGTGKTEVLGMRIANLLRSDAQVLPQEILCLTYTEEAAHNMRKRLSSIVGLSAQKVNIHTFHGFCNNIIQNHSEYFGLRQMEPISDLERVELLQSLIGALPSSHPMHRVGASTYYDLKPLDNFFKEMKKENWTSSLIHEAIDAYIADLPNRPEYIYKNAPKNGKVGDLKQHEYDNEVKRMNRTRAAADLFDSYNKKMQAIGRYDYADMLLWVIDAFQKNDYLLQHYQERYQYILVDEFQDTNGAQNEIINMLTNYWGDAANIFVVGDDDQSIYEFQGARIRNIIDFYEKYQSNIQVIVLTENYRSSQAILNRAMCSIDYNKERLINALETLNLDKIINAALPRFAQEDTPEPVITAYYNNMHEDVAIVQEIEALASSGVSLDEVAILYAQHQQADNIIALLQRKHIPYTLRKSINVLDELVPSQVMKIFAYLAQENKKPFSAEQTLFQLLHAPYFGIAPKDIAVLSLYLNSKEAKEKNIKYWRQLFAHEMILSTLAISNLKPILHIARLLDTWIQQLQVLRMPMLLEKIVYDSHIIQWCLGSSDAVWQMQVLESFFEFVHSVSTPQTTIDELLDIIEKMRSEHISLPLQHLVQQEKGVQLYTAHGAKGLEFEYVYLMGLTKDFWEEKKGGNNNLKLPDTLTQTNATKDKSYKTEVARRLFFVALTRAKKHLYISYAEHKNDGSANEASLFITEILQEDQAIKRSIPTDALMEELSHLIQPVKDVYISLIDQNLMQRQLDNFALSPSSLSKYLRCPIQFYYEDVLRTPSAENDSMAFGTAIHYALERAFIEMNKSPEKQFPSLEDVLGYFKYKMRDKELAFTKIQFERRNNQGVELLSHYYNDNVATWNKQVLLEKFLTASIGTIPIKGKIDKIELLDNNQCKVIDYKTGKPSGTHTKSNLMPPNDKNEFKGGDYWRQMVFYKLLLEQQPFNKLNVSEGIFEYVEKAENNPYGHKIIILPDDELIVRQQIETVYQKIKQFEFSAGCGDKDCHWCNFVKDNNLLIDQK